ncbi:MAG TPA: AAA family ATPase [Candidatus Paceibacterota bacterium]|nr:AAA family ATPase [Candidatus Paceibacterota bacterium]
MKQILAIIGGVGSGKDVAAEYISQKLNIPAFQMSQPLKDMAKEQGIEPTRENLIDLGSKLARELGEGSLSKMILPKIETMGIISGIRIMGEINYLKNNADLTILSIEADSKIRFQRSLDRNKLGEAKTYEEFVQNEVNENSAPRVQRLFECMKLADYRIDNNGDIDEFYKKIDEFLHSKEATFS